MRVGPKSFFVVQKAGAELSINTHDFIAGLYHLTSFRINLKQFPQVTSSITVVQLLRIKKPQRVFPLTK